MLKWLMVTHPRQVIKAGLPIQKMGRGAGMLGLRTGPLGPMPGTPGTLDGTRQEHRHGNQGHKPGTLGILDGEDFDLIFSHRGYGEKVEMFIFSFMSLTI